MLSRHSHRGARRVQVSGLAVAAALGLAVATVATAAPATAGPLGKPAPTTSVAAVAGPLMNYAVNATAANRGQTLKVERAVRAAGGSIVASYAEIGVVIAQSTNAGFALGAPAGRRRRLGRRDAHGRRRGHRPDLPGQRPAGPGRVGQPTAPPQAATKRRPSRRRPTVVADPREGEQWDMQQIGADQAHQTRTATATCSSPCSTPASRATTPTWQANIDTDASASCLRRRRRPLLRRVAADHQRPRHPRRRHHRRGPQRRRHRRRRARRPHVLGQGRQRRRLHLPRGRHLRLQCAPGTGADITNNSYYIDPWEFWCDDDADQAPSRRPSTAPCSTSTSRAS